MTFYEPKTDADIQLLAEMNRQLIRDEGHRNPMTLGELYERMRGWLTEYRALIIQDDGSVVGYVLFHQDTERLYIRHFFIVPAFRRKGLGKLAIQELRENVWNSATRLRLEVLVNNPRGTAFWRSVGFNAYSLTMEYNSAGMRDDHS